MIRAHQILLSLFLVAQCQAAAILDTNRVGNWSSSLVGVKGDIPDVTDVYTNIWYAGPADYTLAISNAWYQCPSNKVVKIWPGDYTLSASLDLQQIVGNGKVLRGVGPARTKLTFTNGGVACIYIRHGSFSENVLTNQLTSVNLASDAVKGTTTFKVITIPAWLIEGGHYILDCTNDTNFVYGEGSAENEHPSCGYRSTISQATVLRDAGQIVKVSSIIGTNITIESPCNFTYPIARVAQLCQSGYDPHDFDCPQRIGIENMTIEGRFLGTDTDILRYENAENCWTKNVVLTNTPGLRHVWAVFSYRCTFRDGAVLDSHSWAAGKGYGIALYHLTTSCLVENNIFNRLHISMDLSYGASGNVWSHNLVLPGKSDSGQNPGLATHAIHCLGNLAEGNYIIPKVSFDWTHGSSSHQVLLRNRVFGHQSNQVEDQTSINNTFYNRSNSFIGNILGDVGWHTNYLAQAGIDTNCTSFDRFVFKRGYFLGFGCDDAVNYDSNSVAAAAIAVNYDVVTSTNNGIRLDGFTTNDVPTSFIYSSVPSWWPTGKLWPAFDPTMGASLSITNIYAGMHYQVMTNPVPTNALRITASTMRLVPQ